MGLFVSDHLLFFLVVIACFVNVALSQLSIPSAIDMTQPCQYPVAVGIEKNYIPDQNMWASSITNQARGPRYGRLQGYTGGGAWTSGTTDTNQFLAVDLGYRQVITSVATQGRRGSNEFVLEYYIWFSTDNQTWTVYANQFGIPMMFEANVDDNSVVSNSLPYPLITRYVQINPQRWNRFISLRIELYGCRFDAESASFDGQSRITYDISGNMQYVRTRTDLVKLRFNTNVGDGLLIFADGNQGDYFILELVRGRLHLNLDLGSTADVSGDTTITAGSLLDDNLWHDVEITRNEHYVMINVDRMQMVNVTQGDFIQLDLDKKIHLGGLDNFLQPGKRMITRQNFTGCMENVWFDYMNMIQDSRMYVPRYTIYGDIFFGACMADNIVPLTFPSVMSYLTIPLAVDIRLRLSFDFRTYSTDGLLFLHNPTPGGRFILMIDGSGYLYYSITTASDPAVYNTLTNRDLLAEGDYFTDGIWHNVIVDIMASQSGSIGMVNITVDGRPDTSMRTLNFQTSTTVLIGGGDSSGGVTGYTGCIRNVFIQGAPVSLSDPTVINTGGVINGTCSAQDRCDPNPCEHGGSCTQDFYSFSCDCSGTGYAGAVCHTSSYLLSCEEGMFLYPLLQSMQMWIDLDDSGPLTPFPVNCIFQGYQDSIMELGHDSEAEMLVDGFPGPGSYVRPINYVTNKEEIDEIVNRAFYCEQYIKYTCWQSKLLSDAGSSDPNIPSWGWFVGRERMVERYWGGSAPDSGKCSCGLQSECMSGGSGVGLNPCNCDASLPVENVFDDGYLAERDRLPVMELHFGDTGYVGDEKWGKHILGPLRCEGDNFFDNIVTFRQEDATIHLPTFHGSTSGDIRFQMKTTTMNGIVIQNTGTLDFIEIRIVFGNMIQFNFNVGNGIQTLQIMTAYPLNDDNWHTIHIERNLNQATLRVDQQAPVTLDEPTDQEFKSLDLTSPLVVGAAVDYSEGFVGCIRAFMVNGVLMDLRGIVESGQVTYGVSAGCHPKCESNPCFNNGICVEYYNRYMCDCAYTPVRGWNCGREMGVVMQADYMIKYEMDPNMGDISTDEENIYIGFATQEKQGQLMFIRNTATPPEYISIEVNNNGGVKVIIDMGWYRDEVNTAIPNVDLTTGQQHLVNVRRINHGSIMIVQVDQYPPAIKNWYLPANSDSRFDSPRFIYFGRNETTRPGTGFVGCLYHAQWDNQFPISRVFQDPRGSNIYVVPADGIVEDMCGFEEVTLPPEPMEFRIYPSLQLNTTTPPYFGIGGGAKGLTMGDQALLGSCLGVGVILIIGVVFLFLHYYYKQKREYKTYEAKNAQYFDNPDYAIASGNTRQPEVQKKREWFI